MVTLLSLAQALRIAGEQKPETARATVNVISGFGLLQFRSFLQAYLARFGLPVRIIPESYGGLMSRLLNPEKEHLAAEAHLVVIDSRSIGAHQSIRDGGPLLDGDDAACEAQVEALVRGLDHFRGVAKGQIFILPVMLPTALFDPYPAGIMSRGWLRAAGAWARIGAWASGIESTHLLSCAAPQQDEKVFFEAGELVSTAAASALAYETALALYCRIQGMLPDSLGGQKKLLITDLDGTLWSGILGDDGAEALAFTDTERGRPHWLYQRFLDLLSREGVVLSACSKNAPESVGAALQTLPLLCGRDRFALVLANWNRKSENVKAICSTLNLLPEQTVVVDDSPLELEEIGRSVPGITALQFPGSQAGLLPFLHQLRSLFLRPLPAQDIDKRLASYRASAEQVRAAGAAGTESEAYRDFLESLAMELRVGSVSAQESERVFELLNKTNQFNLTGRRIDREEYGRTLSALTVWTFSLRDRQADHGLIAVAVVSPGPPRRLLQCVLSCRVFSRFVEDAVVAFLRKRDTGEFLLARTLKNAPTVAFFSRILADPDLDKKISAEPAVFSLRPESLVPFPGSVVGGEEGDWASRAVPRNPSVAPA